MSSTPDTTPGESVPVGDVIKNPEILPFRAEVFDTSTEKQRFILLAARDAVLRENHSIRGLGRFCDTSRKYVKNALAKYIHRHDLPAACAIATRCTPTKTYEDLTRLQKRIINETIINQEHSQQEIADVVNCSEGHVAYTQRVYADLIHQRTPENVETPNVASDIPLDFTRDVRNEQPVLPDTVPDQLLEPFDRDHLTELKPEKRFILLAGREWAIRDQPFVNAVSRTTGTSRINVETTIAPYIHKTDDYPVAAAVADAFFGDLSYDSLSGKQRQIVNEFILNPETDASTVSENVECTYNHVWRTKKVYEAIINQKRSEMA